MSSLEITRSNAASDPNSTGLMVDDADSDPAKNPIVTTALASGARCVKVGRDYTDAVTMAAKSSPLFLETVPKKPNDACAWLLEHITEFCAASLAVQTAVADRFMAKSWYITPKFIIVLERVEAEKAKYSPNGAVGVSLYAGTQTAKNVLQRLVVAKLNHRYDDYIGSKNTLTCAQVARMHELGYFEVDDLDPRIVNNGFTNGSLEAVKIAYWLCDAETPYTRTESDVPV